MKISTAVLALGLGALTSAVPLLDPKFLNTTAIVARSRHPMPSTTIDPIADDPDNKQTGQADTDSDETAPESVQIAGRNYSPGDKEVKEEVKKQNKVLDDLVHNACRDTKDEKEHKRCLMKELESDSAPNMTVQTQRRDEGNEENVPTGDELKFALGQEIHDHDKLKGYAQSIQHCSWNAETTACYQTAIITFTTTAFQTVMAKLDVSPEATHLYALVHSTDFDELKAATAKMASSCGQDPLTTPDCIKKLPEDFASAFLDSALQKRNLAVWETIAGLDSDGWPICEVFKRDFGRELHNQDTLPNYYKAIEDCPWNHKTA